MVDALEVAEGIIEGGDGDLTDMGEFHDVEFKVSRFPVCSPNSTFSSPLDPPFVMFLTRRRIRDKTRNQIEGEDVDQELMIIGRCTASVHSRGTQFRPSIIPIPQWNLFKPHQRYGIPRNSGFHIHLNLHLCCRHPYQRQSSGRAEKRSNAHAPRARCCRVVEGIARDIGCCRGCRAGC